MKVFQIYHNLLTETKHNIFDTNIPSLNLDNSN